MRAGLRRPRPRGSRAAPRSAQTLSDPIAQLRADFPTHTAFFAVPTESPPLKNCDLHTVFWRIYSELRLARSSRARGHDLSPKTARPRSRGDPHPPLQSPDRGGVRPLDPPVHRVSREGASLDAGRLGDLHVRDVAGGAAARERLDAEPGTERVAVPVQGRARDGSWQDRAGCASACRPACRSCSAATKSLRS
jgi:hypothetical protein